jgi:hypothetical protein
VLYRLDVEGFGVVCKKMDFKMKVKVGVDADFSLFLISVTSGTLPTAKAPRLFIRHPFLSTLIV